MCCYSVNFLFSYNKAQSYVKHAGHTVIYEGNSQSACNMATQTVSLGTDCKTGKVPSRLALF